MSGRSPSLIRLQHEEEPTEDPGGGGGGGGGVGMLAGAEGHKPTPSPKHQRVEVTHYVQTPWAYSPTPVAATVHQSTVHQGYQMHHHHNQQQVHQHNHQHHLPYQADDQDEQELTFTEDEREEFGALKPDQGHHHQGQSMQGQGQYYQLKPRPKDTPEAPLWVPGESQEFHVSSSPNQQGQPPHLQGHSPKGHSPQGHSSQGHSSQGQSRSREVNEAKLPEPAAPRYGWEGSSSRNPTISSDGNVMVNKANNGAGRGNVNQSGSRSGSGSGGSGTGFDPSRPSAHSPRGYLGADAVRAPGKGMAQQNVSRPKDTLTPNAVSYSSPRRPSKTQGYRAGGGPTGFVIDEEASRQEGLGCCGFILTVLSWLLIIITCPFSLCLCIKVVQEYERAVIFRLGRLMSGGAKGPEKSGLFFIIPCMDSYTKVDLRTVSFDVPPQEVLSKDSVTVAVDAVVYYRVQNATISVTNVEDAARSTRLLAATNLRNVLGTKNLSEILADRENISHRMQVNLDEATDPWGVKVERVEIKDVRLPVQLQRAMAAEAEAAREARAKVIAAEGEHKAARALKDAADVIAESPSALQLRYLQTLNAISAEKNSTIIFPLPIDFLKCFMGEKKNQNQIKND